MGVAYRARDPLLDREVAVKLIPPTMLNSETEQRFQHEAKPLFRFLRTAASLSKSHFKILEKACIACRVFCQMEGALFSRAPIRDFGPARSILGKQNR
jgi:hypothetical protein